MGMGEATAADMQQHNDMHVPVEGSFVYCEAFQQLSC
jgi:hypothetical protein